MCVVRLDYGNTVVNKGLEDILRDDPNVICGHPPDGVQSNSPPGTSQIPFETAITRTKSDITETTTTLTENPSSSGEAQNLPEMPSSSLRSAREHVFEPESLRMDSTRIPTMTRGDLANINPRKRINTEPLDEVDVSRRSTSIARHQSESEIYGHTDASLERSMSGGAHFFRHHVNTTSTEYQPFNLSGISAQGSSSFRFPSHYLPFRNSRGASALDCLLMTDTEALQFRKSVSGADMASAPSTLSCFQFPRTVLSPIAPSEEQPEGPRLHITPGPSTPHQGQEVKRLQSEPETSISVAKARFHGSSSPVNPSGDSHTTSRRSEAAKCRRVYGAINKNKWCKQCRWKKACTRFQAPPKCPP